jgi:hypothetical protein
LKYFDDSPKANVVGISHQKGRAAIEAARKIELDKRQLGDHRQMLVALPSEVKVTDDPIGKTAVSTVNVS